MRAYTQYRIVETESVDELNKILRDMQLERFMIHSVRKGNSMNGITEYEILFQITLEQTDAGHQEGTDAV